MPLAIYRRYRPERFADVLGQPTAVRILRNSVRLARLSHAYLLAGGHGSGKTTCARLLAKAVNCEDTRDGEPCGKCRSCKAVRKGNHPDVQEIDAASYGKVDDVRKLRDSARHQPAYGGYKVYVIDECHAISTEGWNAFLKVLEEPPRHVIFVFATTDPDKLPNTVLSRVLRIDFKRVSLKDTQDSLVAICHHEGLTIEPEAVDEIARASAGSLRDAQSLLEQASHLCADKTISASAVRRMLGVASPVLIQELVDLLVARDKRGALDLLEGAYARGLDAYAIATGVIERLRMLLMVKLGVYPTKAEVWVRQAKRISTNQASDVIKILAYDWPGRRGDLYAAQVLLEVKVLRVIESLSIEEK